MTESEVKQNSWGLGKIGATAAVGSALANLVFMIVSSSYAAVPDTFAPLTPVPVIIWSVIGAFGAVGTFALVRKFSTTPGRTFNIIAAVVLVLSFYPDVAIAGIAEGPFAGATTGAIIVLIDRKSVV